ncbi:MAG: hypothetical protein HWN80_11145 [Candidatus Lokiarchaeota archaeon]|nr:hypothetical protein [Candidatus Lokiarchaeota archaeon]
MKEKNRLKLTLIAWKILNSLCILFSAFLLMTILTAFYYLTAEPPNTPCLMCVGCPCPYRDFIIARNYYLNFLFPALLLLNIISISICLLLITFLKHRYDYLKLTLFKKKYGNSEDLLKNYKATLQSSELN